MSVEKDIYFRHLVSWSSFSQVEMLHYGKDAVVGLGPARLRPNVSQGEAKCTILGAATATGGHANLKAGEERKEEESRAIAMQALSRTRGREGRNSNFFDYGGIVHIWSECNV